MFGSIGQFRSYVIQSAVFSQQLNALPLRILSNTAPAMLTSAMTHLTRLALILTGTLLAAREAHSIQLSNTTNYTNWFGLGDSACYGRTCTFGEFCSDSTLYRSCRSCRDISQWCEINATRMAFVFPSCFYLCEQQAAEKLCQQPEVPTHVLDKLHITLIVVLVVLSASLALVVALCCSLDKRRRQSGRHVTISSVHGLTSSHSHHQDKDSATEPLVPAALTLEEDGQVHPHRAPNTTSAVPPGSPRPMDDPNHNHVTPDTAAPFNSDPGDENTEAKERSFQTPSAPFESLEGSEECDVHGNGDSGNNNGSGSCGGFNSVRENDNGSRGCNGFDDRSSSSNSNNSNSSRTCNGFNSSNSGSNTDKTSFGGFNNSSNSNNSSNNSSNNNRNSNSSNGNNNNATNSNSNNNGNISYSNTNSNNSSNKGPDSTNHNSSNSSIDSGIEREGSGSTEGITMENIPESGHCGQSTIPYPTTIRDGICSYPYDQSGYGMARKVENSDTADINVRTTVV